MIPHKIGPKKCSLDLTEFNSLLNSVFLLSDVGMLEPVISGVWRVKLNSENVRSLTIY